MQLLPCTPRHVQSLFQSLQRALPLRLLREISRQRADCLAFCAVCSRTFPAVFLYFSRHRLSPCRALLLSSFARFFWVDQQRELSILETVLATFTSKALLPLLRIHSVHSCQDCLACSSSLYIYIHTHTHTQVLANHLRTCLLITHSHARPSTRLHRHSTYPPALDLPASWRI
jgi:hypothetical protein